jgi:3-methyladenine DNA glycosylase/8-oxoguanine DNA glycosylase
VTDLQYDPSVAIRHLSESDNRLKSLIEQVGPFRLEVRHMLDPFQALLRSIVYQQLSGHAAAAIYRRLVETVGEDPPTPESVLATPDQELRDAGLSWAKIAGINDLSEKAAAGVVPGLDELHRSDNDEIIERLTVIRGIGRWTVEMLLIFRLGRADILPVTDLGVRKGYMLTYGLDALPTPKELEKLCDHWRPYRSVASWYLWRAVDSVP